MADIVIFGAGDIGSLANFYFSRDSPHTVAGFTVDGEFMKESTFEGHPVVAFDEVTSAFPPNRFEMFVALSYTDMNRVRAEKYSEARARGYGLVSYVSSRCTFLTEHPVGDNCFILEDNTIQPFVVIGSDVTLWSGNHIGHHGRIGDHCFVTSHVVVSGRVTIGERAFIGVNATIRNGVTIGPRTLVGAGALIMKDTNPGTVHLGHRAVASPTPSDRVRL